MTFHTGDRVTITNPRPENADYRGKTGTVEIRQESDGLIAVKGLEGRVREAIVGRRGFYPEELTKA